MATATPTVVVTAFSTTGQRPTTFWSTIIATLYNALAGHLPLAPLTSAQHRFLDLPADPANPSHRVLELLLPLGPDPASTNTTTTTTTPPTPTPTQPSLSALVPLLAPTTTAPLSLELVLQPLTTRHHTHRHHHPTPHLAVFDMDSTLIRQEVIDELARSQGLYAEVSAITEAAMRGEPPYDTSDSFGTSLRARVALLRGVGPGVWGHLKREVIGFTPGAREVTGCLKRDGWSLALLSGGFVELAEWVRERLGMDVARANVLETDAEGRLTGRLREGSVVVDGERKRALMGEMAERMGVPRENVLAVGDGSNDLLMMGAAGLGIAFCAKPKVQREAPARVNGGSLVDVLYVLGWTEEEIVRVMAE